MNHQGQADFTRKGWRKMRSTRLWVGGRFAIIRLKLLQLLI